MLKALKPGTQKAMASLNNLNADVLQGFKTIKNIFTSIVDDLEKIQEFKKKMEKGKQYLKLPFGFQCSEDSSKITHSMFHALCNPSKYNTGSFLPTRFFLVISSK